MLQDAEHLEELLCELNRFTLFSQIKKAFSNQQAQTGSGESLCWKSAFSSKTMTVSPFTVTVKEGYEEERTG